MASLGVLPADVEPQGHRAHPADHRADRAADREGRAPTRSTATSTSRSAASRTTASSRARTSTTCRPARASRSTSASATRSTSRSGRRPSRASRPGTARGARAARAGTSSARRWRCEYLGETIDLHGGGKDLDLPAPRERDRPVARPPPASPFARYWMHNGFVNSATRRCRSRSATSSPSATWCAARPRGAAPLPARHALPQPARVRRRAHRRGGARARRRLRSLKEEAERIAARGTPAPGPDGGLFDQVAAQRARFEAAMDDDFNTPQALGVLSTWRACSTPPGSRWRRAPWGRARS